MDYTNKIKIYWQIGEKHKKSEKNQSGFCLERIHNFPDLEISKYKMALIWWLGMYSAAKCLKFGKENWFTARSEEYFLRRIIYLFLVDTYILGIYWKLSVISPSCTVIFALVK